MAVMRSEVEITFEQKEMSTRFQWLTLTFFRPCPTSPWQPMFPNTIADSRNSGIQVIFTSGFVADHQPHFDLLMPADVGNVGSAISKLGMVENVGVAV